MASHREALRAHRLVIRRLIAALLVDEARTGARAGLAIVIGVCLASISLATVAVIAVMH